MTLKRSLNTYVSERNPLSGQRFDLLIKGGNAWLTPYSPEIHKQLVLVHMDFGTNSTGLYLKDKLRDFARLDRQDRLQFPSGLVHRAISAIEAMGGSVEVIDERVHSHFGVLDPALVAAESDFNRKVVSVILREHRGQIRLPLSKIAETLRAICRVLPDQSILIIVTTKEQAQHLFTALHAALPADVVLLANNTRVRVGRVTIATIRFAQVVLRDHPDLVLLADPLALGGEVGLEVMQKFLFDHPWMFGFTDSHSNLSYGNKLMLEASAGPVILSSEKPRPEVRWLMAECTTCVQTRGLSPLQRKRAALWLNLGRNAHIAEFAKAMASLNLSLLRRAIGQQFELEALLRKFTDACKTPEIVLVVDSVEHGRELARLLPGWDLVAGEDLEILRSGGQEHSADRTITTTLAAVRGIIEADIVIVASGAGPLICPDFPPPVDDDGGTITLVDFTDSFDALAVRDRQRRVADYQRRGWRYVGPVTHGTEMACGASGHAQAAPDALHVLSAQDLPPSRPAGFKAKRPLRSRGLMVDQVLPDPLPPSPSPYHLSLPGEKGGSMD